VNAAICVTCAPPDATSNVNGDEFRMTIQPVVHGSAPGASFGCGIVASVFAVSVTGVAAIPCIGDCGASA
jgi:hypothetical protein